MQLKLRRSQREAGMMTTNVVFCLDARAEFRPEERYALQRYKLHNQVIYNSEASKRHLDNAAAAQSEGSISGSLKGWASVALAALRLNITVGSLERGQHIECKSMEELLAAEDALMTACENLKSYLDAALTFDGREVIISFDAERPQVVAQTTTPDPVLVAPAPRPPIVTAASAIEAPPGEHPMDDDVRGLLSPPSSTGGSAGPPGYQAVYPSNQAMSADGYAASPFQLDELWTNPENRKWMVRGAYALGGLLLLHSCHIV